MSCQHTNPAGYFYCATCGEALDVIRCRCGFSNPKQNTYCGQCGLKLESLHTAQPSTGHIATTGKYDLTEFIERVEIQKKHDEKQQQEQTTSEEKTETMSQDDIANLFSNLKGNDE